LQEIAGRFKSTQVQNLKKLRPSLSNFRRQAAKPKSSSRALGYKNVTCHCRKTTSSEHQDQKKPRVQKKKLQINT